MRPLGEAFAATVMVPETTAPFVGEVTETVGALLVAAKTDALPLTALFPVAPHKKARSMEAAMRRRTNFFMVPSGLTRTQQGTVNGKEWKRSARVFII